MEPALTPHPHSAPPGGGDSMEPSDGGGLDGAGGGAGGGCGVTGGGASESLEAELATARAAGSYPCSFPEEWEWCGSSNPPAVKTALYPAAAAAQESGSEPPTAQSPQRQRRRRNP